MSDPSDLPVSNNPLPTNKRLRYFNGQFLVDQDFTDEQAWLIDRLRRAARLNNSAGVIEGLALSGSGAAVTVSNGSAVDAAGRFTWLDTVFTITPAPAGKVVISYRALASDQATSAVGGTQGYTRYDERPEVKIVAPDQVGPDDVVLGTWDGSAPTTEGRMTAGLTTAGLLSAAGASISGRLGIGTTDPTATLDVRGDIQGSGALTITGTQASSFAGQVGIGTATPGAALDVGGVGTIRAAGTLTVEGSGASSFKGAVGVGTTFPTASLDVYGNTKVRGSLQVTGGESSTFMGNVGVGTATPGAKLDVHGDMRSTGTLHVIGTGPSRITGRLGIGIDPEFALDVGGEGNIRATGTLTVQGTGTSTFKGPVLITATTPGASLEIRKDLAKGLGPIIHLRNHGGFAEAGGAIDFTNYDAGENSPCLRIQSLDDGCHSSHLRFLSKEPGPADGALTERLRITASGTVGVGTQTPNANMRLHVAGNILGEGNLTVRGSCIQSVNPGTYKHTLLLGKHWKIVAASLGNYTHHETLMFVYRDKIVARFIQPDSVDLGHNKGRPTGTIQDYFQVFTAQFQDLPQLAQDQQNAVQPDGVRYWRCNDTTAGFDTWGGDQRDLWVNYLAWDLPE